MLYLIESKLGFGLHFWYYLFIFALEQRNTHTGRHNLWGVFAQRAQIRYWDRWRQNPLELFYVNC